jgi:hypothetical protein
MVQVIGNEGTRMKNCYRDMLRYLAMLEEENRYHTQDEGHSSIST